MNNTEAAAVAQVLAAQGLPASAITLEEQARDAVGNIRYSRTIMRERGWRTAILVTEPHHIQRLCLLGIAAQHKGEFEKAKAFLEGSLILSSEIGDNILIAKCLVGWGELAGAQGQLARAARLLAATEQALEPRGQAKSPAYVVEIEYNRAVAAVRSQLSEDAFHLAWTEGQIMSMSGAIAYALEGSHSG